MASKALPFSAFDEKTILKDLRQFIRDRKHLDRRWNALVKEHAGEWVGVYRREIIFARSLEDLLKAAGDKGWDLGGVSGQPAEGAASDGLVKRADTGLL